MIERTKNNQGNIPAGLAESAFATLPYPPKFQAGFDTYLSPYTYRYGTEPMRAVWSQQRYWQNVRNIWVAVAEMQQKAGLVTEAQVADLQARRGDLSVERIWQIERDRTIGTSHDILAAIAEYSEWAPVGGRIVHKGMTSEDALSNAEMMQMRDAYSLIGSKLVSTLRGFGKKIDRYKDLPCMAYTHLQAAEPTTVGYRFARYAQDLLLDMHTLDDTQSYLKGKGIKGAVGTSATFVEMLQGTGMSVEEFERGVMEKIDLDYPNITAQTYPRKLLFNTVSSLAGIAQSLHRFALDLQLLQSSFVHEVAEPRRKDTPTSSSMPHKRNPINSENIDSLTEVMPGVLFSAWMTGAFETLERTLRDSAGKRSWLPEGFLIIDEALTRAERVVSGLVVYEPVVEANLRKFGPFCATEPLMDRLNGRGMDRKMAHQILAEHAEVADMDVATGLRNPMERLVLADSRITSLLSRREVRGIFRDIVHHTGDAPRKCERFLDEELYPYIGKN